MISKLPQLTPRLSLIVAFFVLAACSSAPDTTPLGSADTIYERAKRSMNNGNFRDAIFVFEQLESRYPFSTVGKQSQLDLIYCYYKSGSREQAIDAADQFMRENPTHPRVDYALYIKGLSYFDSPAGPLDGVFNIDRADRPPNDSQRSFSVFRQLVERYPASDYSDDAVQRMRYIKDKLARYENTVADYYLRIGAHVAALNRAKRALQTYDGTSANEESLRIMIDSYDGLGLDDLAASTREVLAVNFPGSAR
ncbi:MAG: outer membrane protein assembly factor BamD [Woeseiaceae bacterium]